MAQEHRIHAREVQVDDERVVFPADTKRVASYSWSASSTSGQPRIFVPGSPLKYVPPTSRLFELGRDGGEFWFDDENVIKMRPYSPMEPLFHSLSICAPDVDLGTFDIITDASELTKLLRFHRSPGDRDMEYRGLNDQPFKFFIHAKGPDREGKRPTLVFSPTRATEEGERYSAGFGGRFYDTVTEKDPAAPADAIRFHQIRRMELDGISLLVRSEVGARDTGSTRASPSSSDRLDFHRRRANNMGAVNERLKSLLLEAAGQAEPRKAAAPDLPTKETPPLPPASSSGHSGSADDGGIPSTSPGGLKGPSRSSPPTGSGLESIQNGELLREDAKLMEVKVANGRFEEKHNWKDFLWRLLLAGSQTFLLGVYHLKQRNRDLAVFHPEHFGTEQLKARADKTGSSSLVYLANTLREVIKVAHHLIANNTPRTDGGGVVVEYKPGGEKVLRLRLAVPEDGAIAP